MAEAFTGPLERLDSCRWRIPRSYKPGMRVDGLIYADDVLIDHIRGDRSPEQVANVACLPGIVKYSLAMPDIHWGYGFCIGGVAATDPGQGGVISPGGVGYDINCGVRLIRTDLRISDVKPRLEKLVNALFANVPCGVGQGGRIKFRKADLARLLEDGSPVVVRQHGLGWESDLEVTEAGGCIPGARPDYVSDTAYERGAPQCGTLGSGNHFMEVQVVDHVDDAHAAQVMGLEEGIVTVMIHSGSRGLGYQVCEDFLKVLQDVPRKYGIDLPDRQLVCAPVHSPEGQRYLGAMRAAANYAWCNRQIMTHLARQVFAAVFEAPAERLGMHLVYDVAHNIAKMEPYDVDGRATELCVHRKGATRAFPPGHPELPPRYRGIGQPVLVPGDMGRASYVLVGLPGSMDHTFGSCCHGAGRMMSRGAAIRASKGRSIHRELLDRGVIARARGRTGLEEEQPDAYKDVTQVVSVLHEAGISRKVARLRPVGVIKG
ncbi:MAG: RNA-splicing ligase RtcB [Planctomycetota bacterium]|nr:MAG: RNA-splicing ligase RtcB [Planctomycetota bacterium]